MAPINVSRMAAAGRPGPGLQHAIRNDLLQALGRLMADYQAIHPCSIVISANARRAASAHGLFLQGLGYLAFPARILRRRNSFVAYTVFAEAMDMIANDCPVTLLPGISAYKGRWDITSGLRHCHDDRDGCPYRRFRVLMAKWH